MSLVKLREPREQDLWVCLFFLSHRREQQQRKPTPFPGHSRFPSQRESLLGDDGCSEEDVRGFSSTPSFRLELIGNRKYNWMDAYKMAFRSVEAALPYPVVPVRLAQLLSDIEESTFLCYFPFSLRPLALSHLPSWGFLLLSCFNVVLLSPLFHHPLYLFPLLLPWQIAAITLFWFVESWSRRIIEVGLSPQSQIHLGQQPCLSSSSVSTTFFPTRPN